MRKPMNYMALAVLCILELISPVNLISQKECLNIYEVKHKYSDSYTSSEYEFQGEKKIIENYQFDLQLSNSVSLYLSFEIIDTDFSY